MYRLTVDIRLLGQLAHGVVQAGLIGRQALELVGNRSVIDHLSHGDARTGHEPEAGELIVPYGGGGAQHVMTVEAFAMIRDHDDQHSLADPELVEGCRIAPTPRSTRLDSCGYFPAPIGLIHSRADATTSG